jgi:hypothetical protein
VTILPDWKNTWCSIKPREVKNTKGGQYDTLIIDGGRKLILAIEDKLSAKEDKVEIAMKQLSAQSNYFKHRHGFFLTSGNYISC